MEQIQQWDAASLDTTRKHILRAQTELDKVVQTAHLASASCVGFHPDVNRRLLGPLPPRPVQVGIPLDSVGMLLFDLGLAEGGVGCMGVISLPAATFASCRCMGFSNCLQMYCHPS